MSASVPITEVVLPGVVEPDGLIVRQGALGELQERQIRVRVLATGVSSAENSMRRDRYPGQPKFPFVPGYDLVGEVVSVNSVEDELLVGRWIAAVTRTGAWASSVALDARDVMLIPKDIEPAVVEAVLLNGITAWQVLHRSARVGPGATVLVHGASGGVGSLLVQMARHQGIRVIGTGSRSSHGWLCELGAEPLDDRDPELPARLGDLSPGGFDAVFDNIGGRSFARSFRSLAPGGTLVGYGSDSRREDGGNPMMALVGVLGRFGLRSALPNGGRSATFYNFWSGRSLHPTRFFERLQEDLDAVLALVRSGEVQVRIAARYPLEQAPEALALADRSSPQGKIILEPG